MPEIPTRSFSTTIPDESTEISEDPYSQTVRRSRAEQSMQESYLEEVSRRIRAERIMQQGWQRLESIEEIHSTLDAMTAHYVRATGAGSGGNTREYPTPISEIESKRSSNLKVLAKKEKEILNENKST